MTTVEPIRNKDEIKKVEKILAHQSQRDLVLFTLGINSGLRISDILALNVGDVRMKTYIQLVEKKTGKTKKIPINAKLKPMFDTFTSKRDYDEPLFLTAFNNRLNRIAAYTIIKDACASAGIEAHIGTHTMRKTFGYHHYKKFRDLALLQKIFNHSNPQVTLRYIGIEQDQIEDSYTNFVLSASEQHNILSKMLCFVLLLIFRHLLYVNFL